jgi:hypothetical protein
MVDTFGILFGIFGFSLRQEQQHSNNKQFGLVLSTRHGIMIALEKKKRGNNAG